MNARTSVSIVRLRHTLEKAGHSTEAIEEILRKLGRGRREIKPLKMTRKVIDRCLVALEKDGQAGLYVTRRRKIYVTTGVKITHFNFQHVPTPSAIARRPGSRLNAHNLTTDQKIMIFRERQAGVPVTELCRKYGVSNFTIYKYGRVPIARENPVEDTRGLPIPAAHS